MSYDRLGVVIPAFNEALLIGRTLDRVRISLPRAQVIVADGGSSDGTSAIAARAGATLVEAPRGRGIQCHAGAMQAASEWLLFLHADTLLPLDAERIIAAFTEVTAHQIATFRVRFEGSSFLTVWARFTRFDSVFTRFADQGILVRRSFYDRIGGFPPWPLFEEIALFQRARELTNIHWLPASVTTSARRFRQRGVIRQRLLNAELLLRYLAGASPFELAERYHSRLRRPLPDEPVANASEAKTNIS